MRGGFGVEGSPALVFEVENENRRPVPDKVDDKVELDPKKVYKAKNEYIAY